MSVRRASSLAAILVLATPGSLAGQPPDLKSLPVNTWVLVEDAADGGTMGGIVYLPEQKGMFLWGIRRRKDWRGRELSKRYWMELFRVERGQWEEWVPDAGRVEAGIPRGSYYAEWVTKDGYELPALPYHNVGFWHAHQFCYLPDHKKLLYFLGGLTFTYDPATRTFEHTNIPFGQAPPDVMLGSMAWDPQSREVILFGGGYLRAYQARPGDVKQSRPPDAWTPDRWDRRGTWAYDPAENRWRKLKLTEPSVASPWVILCSLHENLLDLMAAVRGVALEYGDLRTGKTPPELARFCADFAANLIAFADKLVGGSGRVQAAGGVVRGLVAPKLREAAAALEAPDGWRALHALEAARVMLGGAGEILAPAPRPRHYGRMVYDPRHQVIVLFGGDGEDRYLADTWLFHPTTGRWERCHPKVHPPPSRHGMVAMDYDAKRGLVALAQQDGAVWAFDAGERTWQRLDVAPGPFGRKGYPHTGWISIDYDPEHDVHVLVDMVRESRKTLLLRLDPMKTVEVEPSTAEEVWRDDKYQRAWAKLPKTQAGYRERVAEHAERVAAVPPNTWTEFPCDYGGWGRAYGSFCYDWDREQIVLWGGGHSAYMGNEVSHYDLEGNLWFESWNPEFPPHPYGHPDGPGWHPSFYHEKGTHHGYHHYVYCADLKRIVFFGGTLQYDPDRLRYAPQKLRKVGKGMLGQAVEMNGAPGLMTVSAHYWRGAPFGVWQANLATATLSRIEGSDTPFGTNDRAKIVFDTARRRILFYGAATQPREGEKRTCNQLWAFPLDTGKWEHLAPNVEPEGEMAPKIEQWNYCYSRKHDCLFIAAKQATWAYDCKANVLRKVAPGIDTPGVVYSLKYDLFYALCGGGYKPQRPFVFRYVPRTP